MFLALKDIADSHVINNSYDKPNNNFYEFNFILLLLVICVIVFYIIKKNRNK